MTKTLSSPPTVAADGAVWPSSVSSAAASPDERFYTALGVMSAAAIQAAFSGNDGTLRDAPDSYHRERDTR